MAHKATVEGLDQLMRRFDALSDKLPEVLATAGKRAMLLVEHDAKSKVPRRTGDLSRSLTTEVIGSGDNTAVYTGTNKEYAPHVEFGTRFMPGRPYLRPAFDENKKKIIRTIIEGAQEGIKEAIKL